MIDYGLSQEISELILNLQTGYNSTMCFQRVATWMIANYNYATQLYNVKEAIGLNTAHLSKANANLKATIDSSCISFNNFSSNSTINIQISKVCSLYIDSGASVSVQSLLVINKAIMVGDTLGNITICSQDAYNLCINQIEFCGIYSGSNS